MKFNKWGSLPFCLAGLCLLALSVIPACAQTSEPTFLKYKVMGVVYAPPGAASNVTYGQSNLVGSTDTISSSFSNTQTASIGENSTGGVPGLFSSSFGFQLSTGWTESSEKINSLAMQTTIGNSISTMGPISSSLGVDHDNDVIYIWLNPVVTAYVSGTSPSQTLNWTGLVSNSCDATPSAGAPTLYQDVLGCDPNQYPYPDIIGVPVWCLKNPYSPAPGCAQWVAYTSRSWDNSFWGTDPTTGLPLGPGLTMRDYADILQADPFVQMNGNAVNVCHPSYGPSMDPNEPESVIAPTVSAPAASGAGGSCTVTPTIQLGVTSGGALNGCSKILQAGAGCGTGSGISWSVMGGGGVGGTGGTVAVPTADWTSGALSSLSSCTATGGTGYNTPSSGALPAGDVNMANPTASPNSDLASCGNTAPGQSTSARFQPYGAVEYPVPGPNGLPSTYSGTFQYNQTTTNTNIETDSHSVGASLTYSITVGDCAIWGSCVTWTFSAGDTLTWQNQSNMASTSGTTAYANYSITGPQLSDNYTGPATYNVYLDNIYGTYAFFSDMTTPVPPSDLGSIGINVSNGTCVPQSTQPCTCSPKNTQACLTFTPSVAVPVLPAQWGSGSIVTSSAQEAVILTNTSQYQMTMAGPAVTFSDPGYQIVAGSDTCSNSVVAASGTCTLTVEFTPVASDVAQTPVGKPQVVNSYMVAAGTVNAPSDQNILVTNYGVITGTASPATNYATLYPTPIQYPYVNLQNPGAPNLATFPNTSSTPDVATFTFTNSYPYQVTISSIVLSNSAGLTLTESPTIPCTAPQINSGSTCQFTLTYTPDATGAVTKISAVGTVNTPGVATALLPTVVLASAGVNGAPTLTVSVLPASLSMGGTYYESCPTGNGQAECTDGWQENNNTPPSRTTTVTNNTASTVTNLAVTGGASICLNSLGTIVTQLVTGASCTITVYGSGTTCTSAVTTVTQNGITTSSCTDSYSANLSISGTGITTTTVPVSVYNTIVDQDGILSAVVPITIHGVEKSATTTVPATAAAASLTIQPEVISVHREGASSGPGPISTRPVSKGSVVIQVGSYKTTVNYLAGSTPELVAWKIAAALNVSGSPVKAKAIGTVVALTSIATGSKANLAFSVKGNEDFKVLPSGSALAGGANASTVTKYDAGIVSLFTNGVTASAQWAKGSTAATVAQALAASVNQIASEYWLATANGDVVTLMGVLSSPAVKGKSSSLHANAIGSHGESAASGSAAAGAAGVFVTDTAGFTPASFDAATN